MRGLVFLLLHSCSFIREYPDNPIEEAIEDVIEEKSGIKVDFTGSTQEK